MLRVLLVEDNETHRHAVSEVLGRSLEAEVTSVATVEAALSELAQKPYDVAVVDFLLPGADGLSVLQEIRGGSLDLPVVVVTGVGNEQLAVRALKEGAYDYVVKGRGLDFVQELPRAVEEAVRSFRAGREQSQRLSQLQAERQELVQLSIHDDLTELFNRRYLEQLLPAEFERARRYQYPLSLLMVDIDGVRALNLAYGHRCGSAVIQRVAAIVRRGVRASDLCFRYGGDEYLLMLPHTGEVGAIASGLRVCQLVAEESLEFEGRRLRVTVSGGTSTFWESNYPAPEAALQVADTALFQAKAKGGNTVVSAGDPPGLFGREATGKPFPG